VHFGALAYGFAVDGRTVGLLIGAVGGTAFVVLNALRLPFVAGLPLAVSAVVALVVLVALVLRRRGGAGVDAAERVGDGSGMYGRGYRAVVAAEVVAVVAGVVVLGRLGLGLAVLPWVAFVVGVHFVALGRIWRQPSLVAVGAVVAVAGGVGFALALAGAPDPAIAVTAGIVPGAALLAGSWWAATRR
jgi:hypothetical protein